MKYFSSFLLTKRLKIDKTNKEIRRIIPANMGSELSERHQVLSTMNNNSHERIRKEEDLEIFALSAYEKRTKKRKSNDAKQDLLCCEVFDSCKTVPNKLEDEVTDAVEEGKKEGVKESQDLLLFSPIDMQEEGCVPRMEAYHFLVVDDNVINLKILVRLLSKMYPRASMHQLTDSTLVMEKFKHNKYDIAFLDIEMPKLNGLELAKKIRRNRDYNSTALIAVTSKAEEKDLLDYAKAGIDHTFKKPLKCSLSHMDTHIYSTMCYRNESCHK